MIKFEESEDPTVKQLIEISYQFNLEKNKDHKEGFNIDDSIKIPETFKIPFWMTFSFQIISESKDNSLVQYDYKILAFELKPGSEEYKAIKNEINSKIHDLFLNLTLRVNKKVLLELFRKTNELDKRLYPYNCITYLIILIIFR